MHAMNSLPYHIFTLKKKTIIGNKVIYKHEDSLLMTCAQNSFGK